MKMIKLVAATALAVGTVTGALVESAEARGVFPYIIGSGDEETIREINETFLLFNETPDEQFILDEAINDPNLGLFRGAVEEFNSYSPAIINSESGLTAVDDPGDPNDGNTGNFSSNVFQSIDFDPSSRRPIEPSTGEIRVPQPGSIGLADLEAKIFTGDEISSELGFEVSDTFQESLEIIRYRILESGNNDNVLQEAFLFTDSDIINNLSAVLNAGGAENILIPSSLGSSDFASNATNSLTSIISETENLFGLSLGFDTAQDILDGDLSASDFSLDDFIAITPDVFVLNTRFEEVANVPEPGTATTLLGLGVLGVGLGLKRKLK